MSRYGTQYGPDIPYLGVDRCDLADSGSFAGADVVVLGAPFDGGTPWDPSRPLLAGRQDTPDKPPGTRS